jgi:hypothetical protein
LIESKSPLTISQLISDPPKLCPHNFVFPRDSQFSFSNYIKVIYFKYHRHSFSTADGSSDELYLKDNDDTLSEFLMPEPDNVGKVTIHYWSETNRLIFISVFDRKGKRLFKTNDELISGADRIHTIELLPGERWVGVKSYALEGYKGTLYDIQIVIMGKYD